MFTFSRLWAFSFVNNRLNEMAPTVGNWSRRDSGTLS